MALFIRKLGIDLGTANILVYVPGRGIVLNEPSVVAVSEQDNKILAVGLEAKSMIGKTPDSIIAYRPMKDGVIADYRVTEAMLRYYIGKALGKFNIFKPDVLVSVPAGVTSTERRAVIEAAMKAGAKRAFVVKEPILAAIGAGILIEEANGHMIVDIGGGTTDVAVISLGGIVASTSVKCAGDKIDHAIVDYIKKTFNLAIGDKTAEDIKIKIGSAIPVKEKGESMRVITTPGEYEIKDTFIYGIAAAMKPKKDSGNGLVIYRIEIDGLSLVFLGALDTPLQNGHLEHLEKTDILFIPVGGGSYINAESAQELISQISPKIVIPMCYKIPGAKAELDGIDKFYKEMGVKPADVLPRLKISKKDLVSGETIIKILGIE